MSFESCVIFNIFILLIILIVIKFYTYSYRTGTVKAVLLLGRLWMISFHSVRKSLKTSIAQDFLNSFMSSKISAALLRHVEIILFNSFMSLHGSDCSDERFNPHYYVYVHIKFNATFSISVIMIGYILSYKPYNIS